MQCGCATLWSIDCQAPVCARVCMRACVCCVFGHVRLVVFPLSDFLPLLDKRRPCSLNCEVSTPKHNTTSVTPNPLFLVCCAPPPPTCEEDFKRADCVSGVIHSHPALLALASPDRGHLSRTRSTKVNRRCPPRDDLKYSEVGR